MAHPSFARFVRAYRAPSGSIENDRLVRYLRAWIDTAALDDIGSRRDLVRALVHEGASPRLIRDAEDFWAEFVLWVRSVENDLRDTRRLEQRRGVR